MSKQGVGLLRCNTCLHVCAFAWFRIIV